MSAFVVRSLEPSDAPYAEIRRFYRAGGFVALRIDRDLYGGGDDRYDRLLLRLPL